MCELTCYECKSCRSRNDVKTACAFRPKYYPKCEHHRVEIAGDRHPELFLHNCEACDPSFFAATQQIPEYVGLNNSGTRDPTLQRLYETSTGLQMAIGLVQARDLYDPTNDSYQWTSPDRPWTLRENQELDAAWPQRDIPFESKLLRLQSIDGNYRSLMELEARYRNRTGKKFASYAYLKHVQKQIDNNTLSTCPWTIDEISILRYACSQQVDWDKKVLIFIEKTGKLTFQNELRHAAIKQGYIRQ